MQHEPVESGIRHYQIASTPQNKQLDPALPRPIRSLSDLFLCPNLKEPPRRPANPQGRKRRKRLVFFK
jgi:hypothetical protein